MGWEGTDLEVPDVCCCREVPYGADGGVLDLVLTTEEQEQVQPLPKKLAITSFLNPLCIFLPACLPSCLLTNCGKLLYQTLQLPHHFPHVLTADETKLAGSPAGLDWCRLSRALESMKLHHFSPHLLRFYQCSLVVGPGSLGHSRPKPPEMA
jgi:hypothetical protein